MLECQVAASGPVSASPSPTTQATQATQTTQTTQTTQATIRSGLSKAAPKACSGLSSR